MDKHAKIYVAGGQTLVGAAILRQLAHQGYDSIVGLPGQEPDLTNAQSVDQFFTQHCPEYVFLAAGKSGGIQANQTYPATLMLDNLLIACNTIQSAHRHHVQKLLYLASSCSYPRNSPQPMQVESLLTGTLEPTNESYAVAKLAGMKLCEAYRKQYGSNFIVGIPANPFGIGDDFSLEESHVIPALIRKMHEAKGKGESSVTLWGTGTPRREFIFADDLADACLFVMKHYSDLTPINLGGGTDVSIRELAELIKTVVGFTGDLCFDSNKPDGMPLKALDASPLLVLGWQAKTSLQAAIAETYRWWLQNSTL